MLDYSRQDSLERRASSLESSKSSQERDHSKGSKDTLDDDTPPEPLERDYPQSQPTPQQLHRLNSSNSQQQHNTTPASQRSQIPQMRHQYHQQQQSHHSQPQPPPRSSLRTQQTISISSASTTTSSAGGAVLSAATVTKLPSSGTAAGGLSGTRGVGGTAVVGSSANSSSSCNTAASAGGANANGSGGVSSSTAKGQSSHQQSDVILWNKLSNRGTSSSINTGSISSVSGNSASCTSNKTQAGNSNASSAVGSAQGSAGPVDSSKGRDRTTGSMTQGVRHSHSSPPNSLFTQASLEVHPVDGDDIDVDSSPSPGMAPGCGSGGRGPFERRFRMSLDEALRERREKMGEVVDDGSEPRSDEDSLIEHQQTGSDLDEGDEDDLVSNSPTGFRFSIVSSNTPNTSNPLQLPPRTGPIQRGHSAPLRPRSEGHQPQPIYANVQQPQGDVVIVHAHGQHHQSSGEHSHVHSNFLEGGQLSAPLDLALATTPPFPSPNEDPVRYLSDHWGEYRSTGGRPYYYNYVTGEHSWKPPRTRKKFSSQRLAQSVDSVDGLEALDGPDCTDGGLDSSVEGIMPSPPPSPTETIASGWSKVYDDISGSLYFINELNDERWCTSQDIDGRVYFYQEGTQRTAWELPKITPCPPQRTKVAPRPPLRRKKQLEDECSKTVLRHNESEPSGATILRTKTLPTGGSGPGLPKGVGTIGRGSGHQVTSSFSNSNIAAMDAAQQRANKALHQQRQQILIHHQQQQQKQVASGGEVDGEGNTPQNSLRSLKTRSMILSELDWRSKSVDIISRLPTGVTNTNGEQGTQLGVHVLSVQKLPNLADIEETVKRQGSLNKADLVKAGKKVQKKNWVCCFLVLTSKNLFVYKDAQSGQQPTPGEGALSRLALPGALIEWCPDKSKRKNCFQVSTIQGQKVLFQDDNVQTSKEWFESIKGCIIHLPLGYDISGEILKARTPQGRESNARLGGISSAPHHNTVARDFSVGTLTKDTLKRSKKVLRSKSIKLLRPSNTLPGSSGTSHGLVAASPGGLGPLETATGSEKGSTTDLVTLSPNERKRRIGDRLKMFFMRRPTLEMLKEKGIIKDELVFGCTLASLCAREHSTVPRFVVRCIDAIENKDMRADGIYRASGNLSQVQKVRFSINMDDYSVLDKEEDVHVLTGALKMFFREMREPLLTYALFDRLLEATQIKERSPKLAAFEAILSELPTVNRDTLRFLLEHLLRVKEYSSENRMHIQNLAIVFGPTLLSSADRMSRNIAMDTIQQNQVIEFILVEFNVLFC
ncbi:uncharacterized protein LOC111242816 isoform X4 [Varroa destructor]|uniref:Uncharacterized protein n=1 Tax=Varroa destructor TaxID=109461 RepID=A0A7M7IWB8_VARDE|nr:uncharacterized protein LOC111242816 isoform X4 [Varroa destructor]